MIVTIDGPAGSGKSTASRLLAKRLGFRFLDTGAMYRAVALACLERAVDLEDADSVAEVAGQLTIGFDGERVFSDGKEVTHAIRSPEVTSAASVVAANPEVRRTMVDLQRREAAGAAAGHAGAADAHAGAVSGHAGAAADRVSTAASPGVEGIVSEGRDQGSVVFPNADFKFFLTASPEVRARRRLRELTEQGANVRFEQVLEQIHERDRRDATREVAPLLEPPDAVRIDTSSMSQDEVLTLLVNTIQGKPAQQG